MLLNNQWRNQRSNLKIPEANENENTIIQNLWGHNKSGSKREIYSNIIEIHETKKKSHINNLSLHLKQLEKEEQTKHKVSRK